MWDFEKRVSGVDKDILDLSNHRLDRPARVRLLGYLGETKSLRILDLRFALLGDNDVQQLCQALRVNDSLEMLNLGGNGLMSRAYEALSELVAVHPSLSTVCLGMNSPEEVGIASLAGAIKTSTTLERLDLYANGLSGGHARHLIEGLEANSSIRKLNLGGNGHLGVAFHTRLAGIIQAREIEVFGISGQCEGARKGRSEASWHR